MAKCFCSTTHDIWIQDCWNNQLLTRVYDVLNQRTNQIFPFAEATNLPIIGIQLQNTQECLDQRSPPNCSNSGHLIQTIRPDDPLTLCPKDNTHYRLIWPNHSVKNLPNSQISNQLWYGLGVPWTQDILSTEENNYLSKSQNPSNQLLYRYYHQPEMSKTCYPNIDRTLFGNVTKAINHTHDTRR